MEREDVPLPLESLEDRGKMNSSWVVVLDVDE
jgi:hypothetical protein